MEREKINELLALSDIFAFFPKYHNCTNTIWEAMICGAAIITIKTEAIKEILGENDAILIPEKELCLVNKLTLDVLRKKDWQKKFSENIKKRADEILEAWPKRIEKELNLLEQLVKYE